MQPNYNAGYPPQQYGQPPPPVPQQQQQQAVFIHQGAPPAVQTVVAPAPVIGRFTPHYEFGLAKVMGDLLLTAGVFAIVGAILEVITFRIYLGNHEYDYSHNYGEVVTRSFNSFSGFWCGVLMIICGSIVVSGSRLNSRSDNMIIAALISAGFGLIFSIVVLAKSSEALNDVIYSIYIKYFAVMHAGYGIMIACGSLGLIFSLVIILLGIKALVVGFGLINANTIPPLPRFNRQQQSAPAVVVQGQQNYGYAK